MAYRYISAVASTATSNGKFSAVQIGDVPLKTIFLTYQTIYVTLTHDIVKTTGVLNLADLPAELQAVENTLNHWLVLNGDNTLPLEDVSTPTGTASAVYWDVWGLGFNVKPDSLEYHPLAIIPADMREHLILSKSKLDYKQLYEHCLFTVNGYIHRSVYSAEGVYLMNGNTTGIKGKDTQLGLIDFTKLGKLTFIPITPDMIIRPTEGLKLSEGAYIRTSFDRKGKTVALVLGGHLHIDDNSFRFINNNVMKIDFGNIPFVDRYYASNRSLDLSSMNITAEPSKGDTIIADEIFGDEAMEAFLGLSQTFIVLIDAPEVFAEYVPVQTRNVPGHYTTGVEPTGPMVGYLNRIKEYVKFFSDGEWVMTVVDYMQEYPLRHQTEWRQNETITNHRIAWRPVAYANSYVLNIFKPTA